MITILGKSTKNLKPGTILSVTKVKSKSEAQRHVEQYLAEQERQDLDFICISKNYFMIYAKPFSQAVLTNLSI